MARSLALFLALFLAVFLPRLKIRVGPDLGD
jgi:hypothetical protein